MVDVPWDDVLTVVRERMRGENVRPKNPPLADSASSLDAVAKQTSLTAEQRAVLDRNRGCAWASGIVLAFVVLASILIALTHSYVDNRASGGTKSSFQDLIPVIAIAAGVFLWCLVRLARSPAEQLSQARVTTAQAQARTAQTQARKDARVVSGVTCPACKHQRVERITIGKKGGAAVAFGLLSAGYASKTFKCQNCGYKF